MDALDADINTLLYTLENNDVVFLPSVGPVPLLRLLESKLEESILFVSDNRRLEFISTYKLNDDYYSEEVVAGGVTWMSYDLLWFHLTRDVQFMNTFKIVVLDGIDERSLVGDLVFGLIRNFMLKFQNLIVLTQSTLNLEVLSNYLKGIFKTHTLNLISTSTQVETYYSNDVRGIHKKIVATINTIFSTDPTNYDTLILLPNPHDLNFLKDHDIISSNYSIVDKIEDFKSKPHQEFKRLIFAESARDFLNFEQHGIKYVIDSGEIKSLKADETNPSLTKLSIIKTNHHQLQQNINSIIPTSRTNNIKMFVLMEKSSLRKMEYGIQNGSRLTHYILGLFKLLNLRLSNISNFTFLTKPSESTLRTSINQLIYLGLLQLQPGFVGVQVTERGLSLSNFHYSKTDTSFNLYLSLIHNKCQIPQFIQLITMISVLNGSSINKYLRSIKSENDFQQIIELFTLFEQNNKLINLHFRTVKFLRKRILDHYYRLKKDRERFFEEPRTFIPYETLMESLIFGFQFKVCTYENKLLKPLTSAGTDGILLKDKYFEDGDIVIVSDLTYSDPQIQTNQIVRFSSKVPKRILYEMKLPLFKFK